MPEEHDQFLDYAPGRKSRNLPVRIWLPLLLGATGVLLAGALVFELRSRQAMRASAAATTQAVAARQAALAQAVRMYAQWERDLGSASTKPAKLESGEDLKH